MGFQTEPLEEEIERLKQQLKEAESVIDIYNSLDTELRHIQPEVRDYFNKYKTNE